MASPRNEHLFNLATWARRREMKSVRRVTRYSSITRYVSTLTNRYIAHPSVTEAAGSTWS
ncbi:hypothetical protein K523DRAFT_121405 [Schizophyllum commune Tattone D]|nr:hypothetical protein K523DRAFT_121405 [Schizophyllum commune Tattone D]